MATALHGILAALIGAAAVMPVAADEATARTSEIYQQRTADGRIVLSDRPIPGVQVQRSWSIVAEDPVAARERGEKGRRDAQAVSERIERQLERDRQRADAAETDRLRLSLAEARRDAERAREAARETAIVYLPRWRPPRDQVRPVRPPLRSDASRPPQRPRWPDMGS